MQNYGTLLPGILIGLVGIAGMICAYPLYNRIVTRQRKILASRILKLAEELSQQ